MIISSISIFLYFQKLLGTEGTNLQWRIIASHLITRLSRESLPDKTEINATTNINISNTHILNELFVVLGYFAVNNPENQVIFHIDYKNSNNSNNELQNSF